MHLTTPDSLSCYSADALLQFTGFGENHPTRERVSSSFFARWNPDDGVTRPNSRSRRREMNAIARDSTAAAMSSVPGLCDVIALLVFQSVGASVANNKNGLMQKM